MFLFCASFVFVDFKKSETSSVASFRLVSFCVFSQPSLHAQFLSLTVAKPEALHAVLEATRTMLAIEENIDRWAGGP